VGSLSFLVCEKARKGEINHSKLAGWLQENSQNNHNLLFDFFVFCTIILVVTGILIPG
jgi:hypothetical protein